MTKIRCLCYLLGAYALVTWKRTYTGDRELEPEDEDGLEDEVPWDVVEDEAEGEGLEEVEEAKDDPVGQPLDVVIVAW